MNVSTIRSKADFIGMLNPKAWDAVHPHTPFVFSNALVELFVADVVKDMAVALADRALGKKSLELSKRMAGQATKSMLASWEPGDEICPPWPWPWPWLKWGPLPDPWREGPTPEPWREGPYPEPWKRIVSAEQIELAHILARLSGFTISKEFNANLKSLATEVARGAASRLAADFEECGTVPRKPFPKPKLSSA
jgi:hypothetical protein